VKRSTLVAALLLALTCVPLLAQSTSLDEFDKETIASIREVTLQLILVAVGVFALMGGFASGEKKEFIHRWVAVLAFVALGLSVVSGLFAYGSLIYMLAKRSFDPFSGIRLVALGQWVLFGLGGLLFMSFVLVNLRKA
jgi:hypothetical protein